ncbi:MAG: TIGR01548 family HAD-type hydrolase [Planctomycetota bacterium]
MTTARTTSIAQRLRGVSAYAPPSRPAHVDLILDLNEGPTPDATLLESIDPRALNRYPDARPLEDTIAQRFGIDASRVLVTNGGDDAIDRICRAFLEPGRTLLQHTPTFEMIERSARLAGADVRSINWIDGAFPLDEFTRALDDENVAMLALVTPNNPTGRVVPSDALVALADDAADRGIAALIDLAYIEFADHDPTPDLLTRDNVIIVRTFSKALGLAGLRVGYAIAPKHITDALRAAGGPFPVSAPSLAIASASLTRDDSNAHRVRHERTQFTHLLRALHAQPLDSQSNFVTARFDHAETLHARLLALGISVRALAHKPGCEGLLRVTMPGNERDFDRLTHAVRTSLAPEALLFDLDGVLADVSNSYRAAIIETAATFGVTITRDDIARAKSAGNANNDWGLTQRLLASTLPTPPTLEEVTARFQRLYLGDANTPGLEATESLITDTACIERLAARYPLAIVTGRPREDATRFLERFEIARHFNAIICMEDGPSKPEPDVVRLALDRLGVQHAWMIGDTVDDAVAARRARVLPIGVLAPGDGERAHNALISAGVAAVLQRADQLEGLLP